MVFRWIDQLLFNCSIRLYSRYFTRFICPEAMMKQTTNNTWPWKKRKWLFFTICFLREKACGSSRLTVVTHILPVQNVDFLLYNLSLTCRLIDWNFQSIVPLSHQSNQEVNYRKNSWQKQPWQKVTGKTETTQAVISAMTLGSFEFRD